MQDVLLYRPSQAAEVLGVGRTTIYMLIKEGTLPAVRVGSTLKVPRAALESYVARLLEAEHA